MRWHWAREAALIVAAVVLLAEGITIALIYTLSLLDGYALTITTNTVGEFWFEFPVVLASVPLGLFALYATLDRLKQGLDERLARRHRAEDGRGRVGGLGYVGGGGLRAYNAHPGPRRDGRWESDGSLYVEASARDGELQPSVLGRAG